jgi:hypothetical protein
MVMFAVYALSRVTVAYQHTSKLVALNLMQNVPGCKSRASATL